MGRDLVLEELPLAKNGRGVEAFLREAECMRKGNERADDPEEGNDEDKVVGQWLGRVTRNSFIFSARSVSHENAGDVGNGSFVDNHVNEVMACG